MDKVKEVEAKLTWTEADISLLIASQAQLSQSTLVRLGLAKQPEEVVKEPVIAELVETAPKAKPRKISKK